MFKFIDKMFGLFSLLNDSLRPKNIIFEKKRQIWWSIRWLFSLINEDKKKRVTCQQKSFNHLLCSEVTFVLPLLSFLLRKSEHWNGVSVCKWTNRNRLQCRFIKYNVHVCILLLHFSYYKLSSRNLFGI